MKTKHLYEAPLAELLELGLEDNFMVSEYGEAGRAGKELNELDELEF